MKNSSLVSVIIPFYNAGFWLGEAIDSAINQTYPNIEIILIDDGSTKQDTELALDYKHRYKNKIIYVQHEGHVNKGLPATRNAGIAKASGTFVAFLDADDKWMPQKLEKQMKIFEQFPTVQMVCEASVFWYTWQDEMQQDGITFIGAPQGIYQPLELMKLLYPLGDGQPPCPSGIVIKKDALIRCNGFEEKFSGKNQLYEDQAFLSKIYADEVVYISKDANNFYRKRDDSMSSAASDRELYKQVRMFYCNWLEEYFSSSHKHDELKELIAKFKAKLSPLF